MLFGNKLPGVVELREDVLYTHALLIATRLNRHCFVCGTKPKTLKGADVVIVSACSVYIDSAVTSLITERRWALQQTQLVLVCNPHPH